MKIWPASPYWNIQSALKLPLQDKIKCLKTYTVMQFCYLNTYCIIYVIICTRIMNKADSITIFLKEN